MDSRNMDSEAQRLPRDGTARPPSLLTLTWQLLPSRGFGISCGKEPKSNLRRPERCPRAGLAPSDSFPPMKRILIRLGWHLRRP